VSASHQHHVGFAPYDQRFTFWAIVTQAVKALAAERGVALTTIPVNGNLGVTTILEQFITQGVDAAIVMPAFDVPEFVSRVQQAIDRNIRVVVLDSSPSSQMKTVHVRPNNPAGAMLAVEHLLNHLGGCGKLAHLIGHPTSHSALMRAEGTRTVIARYPEARIIFEATGDWSRASGAKLMREALAAHADIQGVICGNDLIALGACDAMAAAGFARPIPTVGFDAQSEVLRAISRGMMTATIWQDPVLMGRTALEVALRVLGGDEVPRETVTDVVLVTSENVADIALQTIDLLPAVLEDLVAGMESQQRLQQAIIAGQQRVIHELSTPIIPITDEIVVMPLVGSIQENRAAQIMETMLHAVAQHHTQVLILDITGVAIIDTSTAKYILMAAQAVQLLGAEVMLVGISPEIAQTIVQLGIDLTGLLTQSTLQAGLQYALQRLVRTKQLARSGQ
jgi:ribose transport system substrate-binding protein